MGTALSVLPYLLTRLGINNSGPIWVRERDGIRRENAQVVFVGGECEELGPVRAESEVTALDGCPRRGTGRELS